ncbi:hypothetical protein PHISCL_05791 [Aspergillus sclerotialis]|uniref:Uncharacterized protein n=1 Tax=Aspergillus sclerotialis TaxID=2070753 RepID=A0A3A2ZHW1_9EURO|nr:hypothetical protein PHISCL_05791 [Aspergillus sclerotialis]
MFLKILLSLFLPAAICTNVPCYWPDGTLADKYTPCGERTSHCCQEGTVCLTNGYCMSMIQPYTLTRATCVDRTWSSDTCKNPCDGVSGRESSGCSLVLYNYDADKDKALYCPNSIVGDPLGPDGIGCADGQDPFSVPSGNVILNRGLLENASCAVDTLNPTAPAAAITHSPNAANTSVPRCASDNSRDSGSGTRNVAIGAGVGVPLGVLALSAVGWAIFERRKRHQLVKSLAQPVIQTEVQKTNLELPDNQIPHELEGDRTG